MATERLNFRKKKKKKKKTFKNLQNTAKSLGQNSLQNTGANNFTRLCYSLYTHKTSNEGQKTHTPYADTDVLQAFN